MKEKIAIVLCILTVLTSANMPVYAAEQQITEEMTVQQAGPVTPDVAKPVQQTEEIEAAGASLTPKTVTVKAGATATDIQKALDLNVDGEYKLTVNIPAGTYRLNKILYVHSNTTIKAAKGAKLIKQKKYGAMLEAKLTNDKGGYNGNHDITIIGGTWDSTPCLGGTANATETLRFIHCTNIKIQDAVICNVPDGSHLITFAGVKNGEVSNCEFYGYGKNTKTGYLTATMPKEAIHLDVVHSDREVPSEQDVYYDDLTNDTITVKNCKFHEFSRGVGTHTAVAGKMHNRVVIENNEFYNLSDSAVRLYNYTNSAVRNNRIRDSVEGIFVYTYIQSTDPNAYNKPNYGSVAALPKNYNITVSGNTIKNIKGDNDTWGDGIRVLGASSRPLTGVKIQNNTVSGCDRYGIWATAAPNLTVNNNQINNTKQDAIVLKDKSNSSVIKANKISSSKEDAVSVYQSSRVAVEANTVTSPKRHGILISKSVRATVKENRINKPGGNGVFVNTKSSYADISGNMVSDSKENGIALTSSSKYSNISGNTVSNYGKGRKNGSKYGIIVFKSGGKSGVNTVVEKNNITGTGTRSGQNAIHLSGSTYVTVSGNIINQPDGNGIYLYKSGNCTIGKTKNDKNIVKNPKEYGIYVMSGSENVKVQYNKISGAKKAGVGVYDSKKSTVKGNTITSQKDGINVNTNSSSAKIVENTINSAGRTGIWVAGGSKRSSINNNIIKKYSAKTSSGNGIYIYNAGGTGKKSNTVVSGNQITGTGKSKNKHAIRVSGSSYTTLEENTIQSAAGSGIYVFQSRNNTLDSNKITAPKKNGIYITTGCTAAKVRKNTIKKAGDISIHLYDAPSSLIASNKITGSKKYKGIWACASNRTTIKSNTITGTKKRDAVSVQGSLNCKVSKNRIKSK